MQWEMVRVRLPLETRVSLPVLNICPLFTILVGMKGKERKWLVSWWAHVLGVIMRGQLNANSQMRLVWSRKATLCPQTQMWSLQLEASPKETSVLQRASCATSHSIPRTHYAPLDAHGLRACCRKHSCRRVPDGLELLSRPSGDQGKTANSRAKQERETRSVVRLFSQDNVGSHFSLSRTGTSGHCSYILHFPSLSHDSTH